MGFFGDAQRLGSSLGCPRPRCGATSIPQLQAEILRLWTQKMEDSNYLWPLVESMPRRLQAVLEKNSNATKY